MSDGNKTGRFLRLILLGAGLLLIGIQLVPVDTRNPPLQAANTIYAIEPVPANVRSVLESSCNNCHSDQTRWPWYSHIAPLSWVVARDVHRGRSLMNFSKWGTYPVKKREQRLEDMCDQLMNGDMPDGKYLLIHRRAQLSEEQKEAVCNWAQGSP